MLPVSPSFGPLGPGITSNLFATRVLAPTGFPIANPANVGNVIGLLGLQQAELAQLNARYGNSTGYQTTAATYMFGYATQAASAFASALADCENQQLAQPDTSAPSSSAGAAADSASNGR
jgi:hypothetical protein